jgi:hypothetical protein
LEEEHRLALAEWEAARQENSQQCRELEEQRRALEDALRAAETSKMDLIEELRSEAAERGNERRILEKQLKEVAEQRDALEKSLDAVESRNRQAEEAHSLERAEWQADRQELIRQNRESEARRLTMRGDLESTAAQQELRDYEFRPEPAVANKGKEEPEQKRAAFEAALRAAAERVVANPPRDSAAHNPEPTTARGSELSRKPKFLRMLRRLSSKTDPARTKLKLRVPHSTLMLGRWLVSVISIAALIVLVYFLVRIFSDGAQLVRNPRSILPVLGTAAAFLPVLLTRMALSKRHRGSQRILKNKSLGLKSFLED